MATRQHILSHVFFLSLMEARLSTTFRAEALPRIPANKLSLERFDEEFLNKMPVLIEGVTHCPEKFSLDSILDVCDGSAEVNTFLSVANESSRPLHGHVDIGWAGLVPSRRTTLEKYVKSVREQSFQKPNYAFGFSLQQACPAAFKSMRMPAHFVGAFMDQFGGDFQNCDSIADVRGYLNNMYFSTNLHIDGQHSAFIASMCEGQKKWSIVTHDEFIRNLNEFIPFVEDLGMEVEGNVVLSQLSGALDTRSAAFPNVTVFEAVQEPGSVLYIPAGAPHAAQTLSEHSLMVATNTYTSKDMEIIHSLCSNPETQFAAQFGVGTENVLDCDKFMRSPTYSSMLQNKIKFGARIARTESSFLEVFGCSIEKLCAAAKDDVWRAYCAESTKLEL